VIYENICHIKGMDLQIFSDYFNAPIGHKHFRVDFLFSMLIKTFCFLLFISTNLNKNKLIPISDLPQEIKFF